MSTRHGSRSPERSGSKMTSTRAHAHALAYRRAGTAAPPRAAPPLRRARKLSPMASGPEIRLHEPSSVGLSQERLDRLLPYSQTLVDGARVPNGMVNVSTDFLSNSDRFLADFRLTLVYFDAQTLVSRHGKIVHCEGTGLQNDASTHATPPTPRPPTPDEFPGGVSDSLLVLCRARTTASRPSPCRSARTRSFGSTRCRSRSPQRRS